jgi:HK97 family phage major capsid protein
MESEVKRLVGQARDITRKAEDEDRSLTEAERAEVERLISETNGLKAKIAEMEDNERLLKAIEAASVVTSGSPSVEDKPAKSLGEAFVRSEGYKALVARGLQGRWSTGPIEFGAKDTASIGGDNVVVEGNTSPFGRGTGQYNPMIVPGIQGPVEQRLTVADLLGQGTTNSNAVVYLKESVTTNGAAVTSEGGAKPASVIDFEKVTASVDKIATFLPISDEMLEDEAQVASYINGRLALFVRQAEEAYLVSAILAAAGTSSSAGELGGNNIFDGIAAAIMHVRTDAGLEPDGLLVSPLDAAKMDIARAAGGEGLYFSGGPYGAPSQNPWGLRRVVTTAVADGAPIVGAFREGGTVWRRGGLSIEASNSHADYFRRNLTALRAEERLAFTIYRDDAFQVVSSAS